MQQEKMKNVTEYTLVTTPLIPVHYLDREQWLDMRFADCENW